MQLAHAGPPQTVSNLEAFRIKRAWRTHLGRNFRTDTDEHRRNSLHFDFALDRYDRAVADVRSTSSEHDGIGARSFVDVVGDFAGGAFIHRFQLHRIAHVADMLFRNSADETFGL